MRTHHVTLEIIVEDSVSHLDVSARVLRAAVDAFPEREGAISVAGFDRARLELKYAAVVQERNELHAAYWALRTRSAGKL